MRKLFIITVNTDKSNRIKVYLTKTRVMKFVEIALGLYIWRPEVVKVDGDKILVNLFPPTHFLT